MPERVAYDEAMLLSQARLKISDQELKQGKVETFTMQTVAGSMKRPWGIQGGFAVVYKFSTQNGKRRALRCFLAKMDPDIQYRYERISNYFAMHAPEIVVEFKYHENGILLKENIYGQLHSNTYPLVEMEWIEGLTLVDYIDELCDKHDAAKLGDVLAQWENIIKKLQQVHISHGDLAGVNVMVRADGRLVLIDYDGVYIPDFSTLKPIVLGQADYQHPEMTQRPFNEHTDDFSAWVIYTAILALHLKPDLWKQHTNHNPQGKLLDTNLLFRKDDFIDPDQSKLFADLALIQDKRLQKAMQILRQACKQPISQVPFFDPIQIDPDLDKKQALEKLELAIQDNDDEAILKAWRPDLLDNYAPAQTHLPRVALAKQIIEALQRLQTALNSRSLQQIITAFDPLFVKSKQFTQEQADLLYLALPFAQAYQGDDDQAIVSEWEAITQSRFKDQLTLNPQEQQRVALAHQRKEALVSFRLALMRKRIQPIVSSYDASVLDNSAAITTKERELLRVAQDFAQAYQSDDDQAIVAYSEAILNFSYRADFVFTTQELQRIELAQLRTIALVKFRMSLISKNMKQIITSYDWVLDDCTSMKQQERDLLRMAKAFVQADFKHDDEALMQAWESIQQVNYQQFFHISSQEQERMRRASRGKTALPNFRQALATKQAQQIVAHYDPILDNNQAITPEERTVLQRAQDLVEALNHEDDQEIAAAWQGIQTLPQPTLLLSSQEQQRVHLAQQRKEALLKFRMAVMSKRIQSIVASYDPVLDGSSNITTSERKQLALARELVQAYQHDDNQAIIAAWNTIQSSAYQRSFVLTEAEMQRVTLAQAKQV